MSPIIEPVYHLWYFVPTSSNHRPAIVQTSSTHRPNTVPIYRSIAVHTVFYFDFRHTHPPSTTLISLHLSVYSPASKIGPIPLLPPQSKSGFCLELVTHHQRRRSAVVFLGTGDQLHYRRISTSLFAGLHTYKCHTV